MKIFQKFILFFVLLFFFCCNKAEQFEANIPPKVSIVLPVGNLSVALGDIINIQVDASDPDGQIDTVYIEFNGENIAQITTIPYEYSFNTSLEIPGIYELKAIASDNLGELSTSTTLQVEISDFVIVPPLFQTLPPTLIGLFGADVTTRMTSFGTFGFIENGVCWSLNEDPTYDTSGSNFQISDNTESEGINYYDIDNLQPGNTYYFRAFATYYDSLDFDTSSVSYGDNIEVSLSSEFYTNTGVFTDNRDDEIYKWITINGVTWMAENLRLADCDGYEDANDTTLYGTFCTSCPDGWAIPTKNDYLELFNFLGGVNKAGKYLKSNNSVFWNTADNATNETLFSALPGGYAFAFDIEDPIEYEVGLNGYYNYLYFDPNLGYNVSGYVKFTDEIGVVMSDNEIGEPLKRTSGRCIKI